MNIIEIIAAWNAQADYMNSWQHLGEDEKLEWAMKQEREACADLLEHGYIDDEGHHLQYAKEIRARGEPTSRGEA